MNCTNDHFLNALCLKESEIYFWIQCKGEYAPLLSVIVSKIVFHNLLPFLRLFVQQF